MADIEFGVDETGARRANLLSMASLMGDDSDLPTALKLLIDAG